MPVGVAAAAVLDVLYELVPVFDDAGIDASSFSGLVAFKVAGDYFLLRIWQTVIDLIAFLIAFNRSE